MVHELEVCLFAERANRAGVRDGFVYFDYCDYTVSHNAV